MGSSYEQRGGPPTIGLPVSVKGVLFKNDDTRLEVLRVLSRFFTNRQTDFLIKVG